MSWKGSFKKGAEVVLASASKKGVPHAIVVVSLGFVDGKLLIADCQMKTTEKNLEENGKVCVVSCSDGYFRIKGRSTLERKGKNFDLASENSDGYEVKAAIVITIDEVSDIDKQARIL